MEQTFFKIVANEHQAEAAGAQKPECTRQYMRISSTAQLRIMFVQQKLEEVL